jgi:prepilin peptidase CpaA
MIMRHPFFPPEPLFAWAFCAVLVLLMVLASYSDLRRLVIPKSLTLTALVLGLLMNLIRGAWLGATGQEVWRLGVHGGWMGSLDALLFSLAGFAAGFALFFAMWILGTCGGGDVKLFAAVGAWVGPYLVLFVLIGTLVFVILFSVLRLIGNVIAHGFRATLRNYSQQRGAPQGKRARKHGGEDARQTRQRLMAYSLPVAVSTVCVLLWFFRSELGLAPHQAPTGNQALASHLTER